MTKRYVKIAVLPETRRIAKKNAAAEEKTLHVWLDEIVKNIEEEKRGTRRLKGGFW